jgi:hypothetical protein
VVSFFQVSSPKHSPLPHTRYMPRPSDGAPLKPETESHEGVQGLWKRSCMRLISEENELRLWSVSVYSRLRRSRVLAWQQLDMNQAGHHFSCLLLAGFESKLSVSWPSAFLCYVWGSHSVDRADCRPLDCDAV